MANTSRSASQREALRKQQQLEATAKRRMRVVGAVIAVMALVVVIVITAAVIQNKKPTTVSTATQITPPNANADKSGILVDAAQAKKGAPEVVVWTDFQCPQCKALELAYGPIFAELAASGDIALDIRLKSQVDQIVLNDSSTRSAVAASCADTVGSFHDYFMTVFENQPSEGVGFTDLQLRDEFASTAGINGDGLTSFQSCFDQRSTLEFAIGVQAVSHKEGITGTPVVEVNGTRFVPDAVMPEKSTVLAEILKLAG